MKQTTKVLLSAVLTIALCLSVISGATFALFTSEAQTNIAVTAGKVKVNATISDLVLTTSLSEYKDNDSANGYTFQNGGTAEINGGTLTLTNVTPGDIASFKINVKNESNVDIQYRVVTEVSGELAQYLEVSADEKALVSNVGEWKPITADKTDNDDEFEIDMVVALPESVGDEAQEKTANIVVKLEAVQGNGTEKYDDAAKVANTNEFWAALANAEAGKPLYIILNGDIEYETDDHHGENNITPASSVVIDGQGKYTLTATGSGVTPIGDTEAPLTLKNLTVKDTSTSYKEGAWELTYLELGGPSLICDNVTFADEIQIGTNATFTNCTFESNEENVYAVWVEDGSATFNNCTFTGFRGLKMHEDYGTEISKVVVKGCTFADITKKPGIAIGNIYMNGDTYKSGDTTYTNTTDTTVSVTGSAFINCQAGDQGQYIYETDTDVTTFNFVNENNTVLNGEKIVDGVYENGTRNYYVSTAKGLQNVFAQVIPANREQSQTVNLMADVDLTDIIWQPINNMHFTFNGNGHTISNVTCAEGWRSGFFGYAGDVTVNDLTLENVKSAGAQAGTFAGSTDGLTTNNCFLKGTNTVTYVPYKTTDYEETYGGIGAVTGVVVSSNINVTIVEGATVTLVKSGLTTNCTFRNDLTGYLNANNGTVVNNGTVINGIATADDLLALGGKSIEGYYALMADLDMTGKAMKSMEVSGGASVVFEGNGHTISNLTLGAAGIHGMTGTGNEVAGLFDLTAPATTVSLTVNRLKVADATVNCSGYAAAIVGFNPNGGTVITLNDVDVIGATVVSDTVAALVGYTTGVVNLTDCDVSGLSLTGEAGRPDKVGALVGTANGATCIVNVKNCTNNSTYNDAGRVIYDATWVKE